jgi:hypothetical protein
VEDHELRRSQKLLGLPLVTLEPPPPLLRRKLDQQGSFEATGSQETTTDQPLLKDLSTPLKRAVMETNTATSSGNSFIPTAAVTTRGVPPPNPPSPVRATMVSTASTSSSGPIPSLAMTTAPFTQNATGPPFSYRMPSLGTIPILSYSTLQTLGLGVGSSNAPLQGPMGGTSAPFNAFPYKGVHIPPSSPSLSGTYQQSACPNTHHSSLGVGSQGPPSHNMSVGSTPFSLFGVFGNNTFLSVAFPTGGNPSYGQPNPL